jgi:hypothetical protein
MITLLVLLQLLLNSESTLSPNATNLILHLPVVVTFQFNNGFLMTVIPLSILLSQYQIYSILMPLCLNGIV